MRMTENDKKTFRNTARKMQAKPGWIEVEDRSEDGLFTPFGSYKTRQSAVYALTRLKKELRWPEAIWAVAIMQHPVECTWMPMVSKAGVAHSPVLVGKDPTLRSHSGWSDPHINNLVPSVAYDAIDYYPVARGERDSEWVVKFIKVLTDSCRSGLPHDLDLCSVYFETDMLYVLRKSDTPGVGQINDRTAEEGLIPEIKWQCDKATFDAAKSSRKYVVVKRDLLNDEEAEFVRKAGCWVEVRYGAATEFRNRIRYIQKAVDGEKLSKLPAGSWVWKIRPSLTVQGADGLLFMNVDDECGRLEYNSVLLMSTHTYPGNTGGPVIVSPTVSRMGDVQQELD